MPGRKASVNMKKELAGSNSVIHTSKGEGNTGQRSNCFVTKKQKRVKKTATTQGGIFYEECIN
ncbi:MAG: hypothetical protein K2N51_00285 [Lachnospiraceae bacterium]|nr:hypothetical protein [Lachnospiraceae bacterium]